MVSRGWVGCSIGYRFSPEIRMPEHLIDCKRILKWLLDHARELGFDPDSVFLTGGSAGAHLALLMALTPNRPEFQPGFIPKFSPGLGGRIGRATNEYRENP